MNIAAGILILANAYGTVIMQRLHDIPNTVCMDKIPSHTVRRWKPAQSITGTAGFKVNSFVLPTKELTNVTIPRSK